MQAPLFLRPLSTDERVALEAGLRSASGFTVRRCQMLLASAEGQHTPTIARTLRCNDQTVRNAIHTFNQHGLAALQPKSSRPHTTRAAFDAQGRERLRALLHQSPRTFGKPTSLWTLELAAEVSFAAGITSRRVSDETIRAALAALGVRWKRAKHWITSPDPAYARKKTARPPDPPGVRPPDLGCRLSGRGLVESAGPAGAAALGGGAGPHPPGSIGAREGRS